MEGFECQVEAFECCLVSNGEQLTFFFSQHFGKVSVVVVYLMDWDKETDRWGTFEVIKVFGR